MERIVFLPFTLGCVSESSVVVSLPNYPKRSRVEHKPFSSGTQEEEEEESSLGVSMKGAQGFFNLPKSNSSLGLLRLFKGLKNIPQLLVYKEELEELEMEMEIGIPTDVKHVAHIGVDGSAITADIKSTKAWENLMNPEMRISQSTI